MAGELYWTVWLSPQWFYHPSCLFHDMMGSEDCLTARTKDSTKESKMGPINIMYSRRRS